MDESISVQTYNIYETDHDAVERVRAIFDLPVRVGIPVRDGATIGLYPETIGALLRVIDGRARDTGPFTLRNATGRPVLEIGQLSDGTWWAGQPNSKSYDRICVAETATSLLDSVVRVGWIDASPQLDDLKRELDSIVDAGARGGGIESLGPWPL